MAQNTREWGTVLNPKAEVDLPFGRSAGFQPAVSPTSSRRVVRRRGRIKHFKACGLGNPRYSRLEVCATHPTPEFRLNAIPRVVRHAGTVGTGQRPVVAGQTHECAEPALAKNECGQAPGFAEWAWGIVARANGDGGLKSSDPATCGICWIQYSGMRAGQMVLAKRESKK